MRQFVNEFYHHNVVHKQLIKKEVLWELTHFMRYYLRTMYGGILREF